MPKLSPRYLSIAQAAKAASLSRQRLSVLCNTGRIEGAFKVGQIWAIPNPFGISPDPRIKKYAISQTAD